MSDKKFEILLIKYFKGDASLKEKLELQDWASNNEEAFKNAVKLNQSIDKVYQNQNSEEAYNQFLLQIKQVKVIPLKTKINWSTLFKYAAMITIISSLGIIYFTNQEIDNKIPAKESDTINEISLTLNDGTVKLIKLEEVQKIVNSQGEIVSIQNKNELIYETRDELNNTELTEETLTYNKLSIPNGMTFKLTLSDGTKVVLNAGSSLRYPTKFIKKYNRQVFLNGEAYFDVATNANQPFIVRTADHNIRVLGTQFNVNSYDEDNAMNTVLVEGSVGIYKESEQFDIEKSTLLHPGQIAVWNRSTNNLDVADTDTLQYTAWIDGKIMFINTPFKHMIKRLERHFDISIQNNFPRLNNHLFTATFEEESIEQVIKTIQKYINFDYSIQNNQIIINQIKSN